MKMYTSYFAKLRSIGEDVTPIAICLKVPDWYDGVSYRKLAPTWDILSCWKEHHDEQKYITDFKSNILDKLDVDDVRDELLLMSNNKPIVLLCYETSNSFCHRHLVSEWFNNNGIECAEYKC